jgi:hypothetical protein
MSHFQTLKSILGLIYNAKTPPLDEDTEGLDLALEHKTMG